MSRAHYLIFTIDEQYFAVTASAVEHVIRAVKPAYPLDAPDLILGLINVGGDMIPLVDIRKQFGLAKRPVRISERIIRFRIAGFSAAIAVDEVMGVDLLYPDPAIDPAIIYPAMRDYICGVATFEHRTVFIYDVDTLIPQPTLEQVKQVLETA